MQDRWNTYGDRWDDNGEWQKGAEWKGGTKMSKWRSDHEHHTESGRRAAGVRGEESGGRQSNREVTFIFRMSNYLLQGARYIQYRVVIMREQCAMRPCYG